MTKWPSHFQREAHFFIHGATRLGALREKKP